MSIVVLPIIIVIALLLVYFFISNKGSKYFTVKITHWLLIIYVGVLVVAMIGAKFYSIEEMIATEGEDLYLYPKLMDGKFDEIDSSYRISENSFSYDGQSLSIEIEGEQNRYSIMIEQTSENNGKIDVLVYSSVIMGGINVSEKIKSPSVSLVDEKIVVNPVPFQEIKLAQIKNEFTINQFKGESIMNRSMTSEGPIVYIRVPNNVKIIEDPQSFYHYVPAR